MKRPERNVRKQGGHGWKLPTPSAFTADETDAVAQWVAGGGSLRFPANNAGPWA